MCRPVILHLSCSLSPPLDLLHDGMEKWRKMRTQLLLFSASFSFLALYSLLSASFRAPGTLERTSSFPVNRFYPATTNPKKNIPADGVAWSEACARTRNYSSSSSSKAKSCPLLTAAHPRRAEECDLFSGRWVHDASSRPLYEEAACPYMSDQLACLKHGRPDKEYQRWRWQPHGCNLKEWNAKEMLEKLRGKRLMFVGDSLNRGQWISMICMLQSAIPSGKKSISPNAALTIFTAEEYNATVEFYWAPLIVESNSDDPVKHRLNDRIVRPGALGNHAVQWEKADILVFNSYLWWRSSRKIKLLTDEAGVCEETTGPDAMELALDTWADWVESRVNTSSQKVFFVTMSPTHLWKREWKAGSEGNCFEETTPIIEEGYWGSGSDLGTMRLVERVVGRLQPKVSVLNITQLSEYRKDGHPSTYRKFWETRTPQQLSNPASSADCTHWCLPGVPDVWNELLFNSI